MGLVRRTLRGAMAAMVIGVAVVGISGQARLARAGGGGFIATPVGFSAPRYITDGLGDGTLWFTESANRIGKISYNGVLSEITIASAAPQQDLGLDKLVAVDESRVWFAEDFANRIGRIDPDGSLHEYPLTTPDSGLRTLAAGADGAIWFATDDKHYGRISLQGALQERPLPKGFGSPVEMIAGPDGAMWLALSNPNGLGRIGTDEHVSLVPLPSRLGQLGGIAPGNDGAFWMGGWQCNCIARVTARGHVATYPLATADAAPTQIVRGPDLRMWFLENRANKIGRIGPDGQIREFPTPTLDSEPFGIAFGGDDNIWFTEIGGRAIGRVTPDGQITEFALPRASGPYGIANGSQGANACGCLWFTELNGDAVDRITTSGHLLRYLLPGNDPGPMGIQPAPDGTVWFSDRTYIGHLMQDGTLQRFTVQSDRDTLLPLGSIVRGPDGNYWFLALDGPIHQLFVGRITPDGGISTYLTHGYDDNAGEAIVVGPDGNLWFTEDSPPGIGRMTPAGTLTEFPFPSSVGVPGGITLGPDGTPWFTAVSDQFEGTVGRMTSSGVYSIAARLKGLPTEIATGPGGTVWVTESGETHGGEPSNLIARIARSGQVTEYPVPTSDGGPQGIVEGPDGAMWFTELTGNNLGRIDPRTGWTTEIAIYQG